MDKALLESAKQLEFETKNNKEYEVKAIISSVVYGKQANDQITGLYYLVS